MLPPALRHPRYRLLWIGLLISIAGSRMQMAAVLWHVHDISGQALALGGVGLVRILPVIGFSLLAGAFADAFNRRRLMFFTQITLVLIASGLAAITFLGEATLARIYLLIALESSIWAFDLPARQALIPNLVPERDLTNAFSMNSIAFQTGSIVGPAAGGMVLAQFGIGYAYAFNALTYFAVIAALILMGPVAQDTERTGREALTQLQPGALVDSVREGLRFVMRQPIILSSMLLDFFATFFSSATALLPIFAKEILSVGSVGYGWLVSAPAIGAAVAAILLSYVQEIRRQGLILLASVGVFGLATLLFGLSRAFWLTFTALVFTGAADSVSTIIRNTIRQLQTPDRLRGRMTSVNQIFFMGGPQLGEAEAGLVAQWFGAPLAVISGGIGCLIATGWIARRFPQLRAYNGDEPVRAGLQAATQPHSPIS